MSLLSQLSPKKGSVKNSKRVGRGSGSGTGKTSGKGHKGQKARSGGGIRWGFEGGQNPLARRLPKFGFNNKKFETKYAIFNIEQFSGFTGEVSPEFLREKGFIKKGERVKILGNGKIETSVSFKAHKFSASAKKAIEQAGGTTEVI